jgi:hypothetical protein
MMTSWCGTRRSAIPFPYDLQSVQLERSLDAFHIEMVLAKNLEIAELIAHAEFVISLELVPVAGSADTLEIFLAIWIAGPQSSDEPCWYDVVHVAPNTALFEIHST